MRMLTGFIVALMLTVVGGLVVLAFQVGRQAGDIRYMQEDVKSLKCNCKCQEKLR